MDNSDFFKKLTDNYPFITVCSYADEEYVGIVQNRDNSVTSIYDYGSIKDHDLKMKFLELGEVWWWESNRMIPINLFLKKDWDVFKPFVKTFTNKGLEIIHGPIVKITDFSLRKTKKRTTVIMVKTKPG